MIFSFCLFDKSKIQLILKLQNFFQDIINLFFDTFLNSPGQQLTGGFAKARH
jgi:hypothetical protein